MFMKTTLFSIFILSAMSIQAQPPMQQQLVPFPAGSIRPSGWLKTQMQRDLQGFVGHLDEIVPGLIHDPIYGSGRLQQHSKAKDLGNLKDGDLPGDEQYKWWNSETQSNWWDGYIRHVFMLQDAQGMEKVKQYVYAILATQDPDGYLGIYDKELRYRFSSENGELWSKTTLLRGLLAYYEFTNDEKVFTAVKRAVDDVMLHYPAGHSSPFASGDQFNGGVSHGLTFTDVLERMYFHTQDPRYRDYALFLYRDYSATHQSECDAQLPHIFDPKYKLWSHGVHSFEQIRPLIVAAYAAGDDSLRQALDIYLRRIRNTTTISGAAIGDEWIGGRDADATHTGYEYCSLQELLDSYGLLLQKTGNAVTGDDIERTFYNAAQGSRDPEHSCIAYLKTDNSFEMKGSKNGEAEPGRSQTRYKYSPAHQDVAVCCNPNAGRITPYFIQHSWMKENEKTLVATLLMPDILETVIAGKKIRIENHTEYPYGQDLDFRIQLEVATTFTLKVRKPAWVKRIVTNETYSDSAGYISIHRSFSRQDAVHIRFVAEVEINKDANGDCYFTYGALVYARPIAANMITGKSYGGKFTDLMYEPLRRTQYGFYAAAKPVMTKEGIRTELTDMETKRPETVTLVPMGRTVLRQVTFH